MSEDNEKHNMDTQALRSDILAINVKLDSNSDKYMTNFEALSGYATRIEEQVKKTNGRVTLLEKWMWGVVGGGSVLLLLPALQEVLTNIGK